MVNRIFSKRTFNSPVFRMAVLMIVVLVAGASLQDSFLTLRNVQSICKQLAEYGILAVAVFICMLSGGIDLSVVYIANLVRHCDWQHSDCNSAGERHTGAELAPDCTGSSGGFGAGRSVRAV